MAEIGTRTNGRERVWKGLAAAITGATLIAVPLIFRSPYHVHLINMIGIYILLASGLNLVLGYAGQISLGQAGFYAIGAYTSTLMALNLGLPFWLGLPAAGLVAAAFGVIIGPVLRLRGHVLAMATLAFGEIVKQVAFNWVGLTRGSSGLLNIPPPAVGTFKFVSEPSFYYIVLGCVLFNYFVMVRLVHSRVGRAMRAIRDNPVAAQAAGIPVAKYKTTAFALAAFFAGLAGSLYAHLTGSISPYAFGLGESLKVFTIVVVGGEGSIFGPIIGSIALNLAPEYFRSFQEYNLIFYGLLLLVILLFLPQGLNGLLSWGGRLIIRGSNLLAAQWRG